MQHINKNMDVNLLQIFIIIKYKLISLNMSKLGVPCFVTDTGYNSTH